MKEIPSYNNQDEKSKFFSLKIIDTDEQLFNFMKTLPRLFNDKQGIWRGLPESRFKLYNSLQRKNLIFPKLGSLDDVIKSIENSINEIEKWNRNVVLKYFDENHSLQNVPLYAALSIMQHYGCETPLLDWTRNPYVALFFATQPQCKTIIRNEIDNYFSIYFITSEHSYYTFTTRTGYNKIYGNDDENPYVQPKIKFVVEHGGDETLQKVAAKIAKNEFIQKKLNNKESIKRDIRKFPIQRVEDSNEDQTTHFLMVNNNINAQHGLFILNADPIRPLEEAIVYRISELVSDNQLPQPDINKALITCHDNFICYDIHKKFIPQILSALNSEQINITEETMFPDFKKLKEEITFEKITNNIRKNDEN